MNVKRIAIRNFRRLEDVTIDIESDETVFVGPNNSGKTSATAVFRCFLGEKAIKVFDFSVGRIGEIDAFGRGKAGHTLPAIELDIWFTIDPDHVSFGRAFSLLPNMSDTFDTVGVRMKFEVRDVEALLADYHAACTEADGSRTQTLTQFLSIDQHLKRHFRIAYYSLDATRDEVSEQPLINEEGKSDGKKMLQRLIRVDFVDAQRNIDDDEKSRSNKLSAAFATFYSKNLEQAEAAAEANQVIEENNRTLTEHYAEHFKGLMTVIGCLGFPALNDRELKIVSALSPETALRGNTELFYRDPTRSHELPEVYNGLGFKNLIYMAIQVSDYHLQWLRTERDRPSCQLIFIEEPEVHLHAQVQQTFITNVRNIVTSAAAATGEDDLLPQFIVTTHSSHILDAVDFERVRYFKRCALEGEPPGEVTTLNASKVSSVRDFQPAPIVIDDTTVDPKESLRFLQRYIKITHCDLFFADAAVLVEGTVEKLLLPRMVEKTAPTLRSAYLSVLEVGGAYAYRFVELLEFLSIPYVVVTDLDSVEPSGRHRACRGDTANALSSNRTLEQVFGKRTVAELLALTPEQKERSDQDCCVVFQTAVPVTSGADTLEMIPRTFEESFAYTNFELAKGGKLNLGIPLSDALAESYQAVFAHVRSSTFKKTEFALDILAMADEWIAPAYIAHGLRWLESRLAPSLNASHPEQ